MEPKPTVFVIDDDKLSRDSMCALVSSVNLPAESYPSAEAFLSQFDPRRPGCIVVDLRMPGMSGVDLQQELLAKGSPIPVILISGYATTSVTVEAMRMGAISVIDKPYRDNDLWDAISRALKQDELQRLKLVKLSETQSRWESLDSDERYVLDAIVEGKSNKVIAFDLNVSLRTVESRRSSIYKKTGTDSLAGLIKVAFDLKAADNGRAQAF